MLFIVAAIVAAFVTFGGVMAWAEYQTRHLPSPVQQKVNDTGSAMLDETGMAIIYAASLA
jgi:hypothetical protein